MPLRYLHLKNSVASIDYDGVDLPDMAAIRVEALRTVSQVLQEDDVDYLWRGISLRLWVTDAPGGGGNTLLVLDVTAASH